MARVSRCGRTPEAARTLALTLGRLKQTTMTLPGDAQELLTALDYVMVGDPHSRRQHDVMEAGKGMTPDGGYKAPENPYTGKSLEELGDIMASQEYTNPKPDHTFWPTEDPRSGKFVCGWTANQTRPRCGLSSEEHGK
jgi:hypothetical protein